MRNLDRKKSKGRKYRSNSAFGLIEALITLVICALISAAFLEFCMALLRTNTATRNEIIANCIAQELIESCHRLSYSTLSNNLKTVELLPISTPTNATGPPIRPEALIRDTINKEWTDKTKAYGFSGKVFYTIEQSSTITNALKVTITVIWSDNLRSQSTTNEFGRTVTTSTLVSKNGLNKWTP